MGLNVGEIFTERGLMLATTKRTKLEARQLRGGSAFFSAREYSQKIAPKKFASKSGRHARAPKGYRAVARKPLGGAPRTGGVVSYSKILPAPFFDAVKAELFDLICTNTKKYEALRKRIKMAANASQTLLVTYIAADVGHNLNQGAGTGAGAVSEMVAAILLSVLQLGQGVLLPDVHEGK